MARTNVYSVHYRESKYSEEQYICVLATSKRDAYFKASYKKIPEITGSLPYSAWVDNVTYQNGNVRYFNTSEGNAY